MVLRNWSVRIGGAALLLLVVVAIAAPWLGTVDPTLFDAASRDLRPGEVGSIITLDGETLAHRFLMGSDSYGRDIYSRVLYGTRVSLAVGLAAALAALAFGIACGLVAGYLRRADGPLMRVMDGIMAIPAILIAIAVVALWRASLATVIVAIAIPEIPRVTRLVRSLVLTLREEPYVEAAVALGTPAVRIMFGHILPNTLAPLLVQASFDLGGAITAVAGLSFIGFGAQPPTPEWGVMISEGRNYMATQWWLATFPALAILLVVGGLNLLGDGLRDLLDPRLRGE